VEKVAGVLQLEVAGAPGVVKLVMKPFRGLWDHCSTIIITTNSIISKSSTSTTTNNNSIFNSRDIHSTTCIAVFFSSKISVGIIFIEIVQAALKDRPLVSTIIQNNIASRVTSENPQPKEQLVA